MGIWSKIIGAINVAYLALIVFFVLFRAGSILGFMGTSIGVGIFFLPVLLGFISAVWNLLKKKEASYKRPWLEKLFIVAPLVIVFMLLVLIGSNVVF